jgi:hypothetical protein
MNILEHKHIVILINPRRRDFAANDFAEDAVFVGAHG